MKNIVFMGTSIFACEVLQHLLEKDYSIVGVFTQPDRKVGRKQVLTYPEVKKLALSYGIRVFQPINISEDFQDLIDLNPDLIITCAYGQFLPQEIVDLKVVNIHASLLPKYRGGAPMHRAIINGDSETGVTLMRSVMKMDAGPFCAKKSVEIELEDTVSSLQLKLIECSKALLDEELDKILNDEAIFYPQVEEERTFAKLIRAEDELIDFTKSYLEVYNHIRGLIDWPVGYALIEGQKLKFYQVEIVSGSTNHKSGTIIDFKDGKMLVAVDGGILGFNSLQLAGKKIMSANDFANGIGKNLRGKVFNED